jgi:CDP-paratose 2-epimerase
VERAHLSLMKIAITGICGFVGSELALQLARRFSGAQIAGIDNFSRPGSETTRPRLKAAGIVVKHGDVRYPGDLDALGAADWVIDAAANPSVLIGVDGRTSSRQAVEHNLVGTLNVLEFCKAQGAGLVLLSTSRVYSVKALNALPLVVRDGAFTPDTSANWPHGATPNGLMEAFSTAGPVSLYGATKVSSEAMAIEYGDAFGFPVVVDRCGVMAGPGQFGTAEQGIFSFWVRAWASGNPLAYLGFGGTGHQVRDALHPQDLADLVERQLRASSDAIGNWNVGSGSANAMSLAQLSAWCSTNFGDRQVGADTSQRRWDVPWVVMDTSRVRERFEWAPATSVMTILDEIAAHHRLHPDWLSLSRPL